ncbi:MAG: efflux RND transporter periplasmic adaptor subunit [Candidatus Adiutrix sp.]|nr:efflux RND transporter periplasmic adaptor subunit [Candidatus Adiutrix sp.]
MCNKISLAAALILLLAAGAGAEDSRKVLYWYDPMYPGSHFEQPGKSPFMDMDLVPRYADDDGGPGILIDPVQTQNLAVTTARAALGRLTFVRELPATVEYNDYQLAKVQPRADGFVEKTYPLAPGDRVARGDPLVEITLPGWASDQSEYLLLRSQTSDRRVLAGVRERLRLSGMPEEVIANLEASGQVQTRITLTSPLAGVVTAFNAYPGMNVAKDMTLATIQGISPVWVVANVPERDLHLVGRGQPIRVTFPAFPDRAFPVQSFTLLPSADPLTRTVPLRLTLANEDGLLKPNLTAQVRLRGQSQEAVLIPTPSLIDLGTEKRVITRAADGSFVPKLVEVLRESRDQTAVTGLEPGEEVVVSGLFLIDSEANLRGALERMRRRNQPEGGESQ